MSPSPESYHVVCCADAGYAQHVAVMFASVLDNSDVASRFELWIITNQESQEAFGASEAVARFHGARVHLRVVDDTRLPPPAEGSYYTRASLYRVLFPTLLPPTVQRAVYLDSDAVVLADLSLLFAVRLAPDQILGAVQNAGGGAPEALGLAPNAGYFNAGVLLVNLTAWRALNLTEQLLDFAERTGRGLPFYDQDALNFVVAGRWRSLDASWNQQYEHFLVPAEVAKLDQDMLETVQKAPRVVHFSGACKPWHFRDDHPFRNEYYGYLDLTPYVGWRPKAEGWKDWARWAARRVVPRRSRVWMHARLARRAGEKSQRVQGLRPDNSAPETDPGCCPTRQEAVR